MTESFPLDLPINLTSSLRDELEPFLLQKQLEPGEVLLEIGQNVHYLPIVKQGNVKVLQEDEDAREILLYYIRENQSCAMSFYACTSGIPSKVKAITTEKTNLILIPTTELSRLWKDESWRQFVLDLYHQRFEELLNAVSDIAFHKLDERLWAYLVKKTELAQNQEIGMTHQEIANDLGTTREVISRLLKQLERKGWLSLSRNYIKIIRDM